MAPKVEVHLLTWQEEDLIAYAIRHYRTFAQRIVVHDAFSTDRTILIADDMGAEVVNWDTGDRFDDLAAGELKNSCWLGTTADWVIPADCDELIYFPNGAEETLTAYENAGVCAVKPHGFEMYAETYPATKGQIYDEVKRGAREDHFYAKPILFSARRVAQSGLGIGAHESFPVLKDGRTLYISRNTPKTDPPTYLLHYHQLGGVERIGRLYDERRARLCAANVKHRWGNFKPGLEHAKEKRDAIVPHLEQVVP